jgi:hypothetical protein
VFLANFAVIATQVGTHIVQALFIATALTSFVPAVPRFAWIFILSPLLVLLSWIRDVSHLRWPSTFGVLFLFVAIICVFVYVVFVPFLMSSPRPFLVRYGLLNLFPSDVIASQINHAPVNFFLFFGTSIYVFEGINMALVKGCFFVLVCDI